MIKRTDDVFFFTLIDFLLQVFYFGLLLYVFAKSIEVVKATEQKTREREVAQLKKVTGVSNLTELTDLLTTMAPLKELRGTADFIARAGGADKAKGALDLVNNAGGTSAVQQKLDKLRKLEEGTGRPPCLFNEIAGKKVAQPLAVVVASDSHITFQGSNPELEGVLALLGRSFESVKELSLAEFRQTFAALPSKRPECRFTLTFREQTRLVDARDAARFSFYLAIENKR